MDEMASLKLTGVHDMSEGIEILIESAAEDSFLHHSRHIGHRILVEHLHIRNAETFRELKN